MTTLWPCVFEKYWSNLLALFHICCSFTWEQKWLLVTPVDSKCLVETFQCASPQCKPKRNTTKALWSWTSTCISSLHILRCFYSFLHHRNTGCTVHEFRYWHNVRPWKNPQLLKFNQETVDSEFARCSRIRLYWKIDQYYSVHTNFHILDALIKMRTDTLLRTDALTALDSYKQMP